MVKDHQNPLHTAWRATSLSLGICWLTEKAYESRTCLLTTQFPCEASLNHAPHSQEVLYLREKHNSRQDFCKSWIKPDSLAKKTSLWLRQSLWSCSFCFIIKVQLLLEVGLIGPWPGRKMEEILSVGAFGVGELFCIPKCVEQMRWKPQEALGGFILGNLIQYLLACVAQTYDIIYKHI